MGRMRKDSFAATFKNSHEAAAAAAAHERHSAVLRYLGAIDPTGEVTRHHDRFRHRLAALTVVVNRVVLCVFVCVCGCFFVEAENQRQN
jgi:hypothetical protein